MKILSKSIMQWIRKLTILTHSGESSLSFLWYIGKQHWSRSEIIECSVWSGPPLFAYKNVRIEMKNNTKQPYNFKWTYPIDKLLNSLHADNFSWFFFVCRLFSKWTFQKILSGTLVSTGLARDQDRHSFGPDLGSDCLQRLSAGDKSGHQQGKC